MIQLISKWASCLTAGALLLGTGLFATSGTLAYADSAQVSALLKSAKSNAAELARDATQMETYTRSRMAWQSHSNQVHIIGQHVNATSKVVDELHSARDDAEPWQQEAIDRITPLLQELATNTNSIIEHLNDRKATWHPEYHEYLQSNAEMATDLSKLIGDYIDYGNAKAKAQGMGGKLGFSED